MLLFCGAAVKLLLLLPHFQSSWIDLWNISSKMWKLSYWIKLKKYLSILIFCHNVFQWLLNNHRKQYVIVFNLKILAVLNFDSKSTNYSGLGLWNSRLNKNTIIAPYKTLGHSYHARQVAALEGIVRCIIKMDMQ